jgi:hypothetical protein
MNETKDLHSTEVVTQPKNRRNWVRMMFTVPADASNTVKMIYALCSIRFCHCLHRDCYYGNTRAYVSLPA